MTPSREILFAVFFVITLFWVIGLISTADLKGSNLILWALLTGILSGLASLEKTLVGISNMLQKNLDRD